MRQFVIDYKQVNYLGYELKLVVNCLLVVLPVVSDFHNNND